MKQILIIGFLVLCVLAGPKKGIGCGTACTVSTLSNLNVTWYYNWGATGLASTSEFIPMAYSVKKIVNVTAGQTYVLGFNEPDYGSSAITPAAAAAAWPDVVSKAQTIISPATAKNPSTDSSWLEQFLADPSLPRADKIAVHKYGTRNATSFKNTIQAIYNKFQKPIWIT